MGNLTVNKNPASFQKVHDEKNVKIFLGWTKGIARSYPSWKIGRWRRRELVKCCGESSILFDQFKLGKERVRGEEGHASLET